MSKKPADVPRRNDPTMTKITRNGSVKFCLDGRCGNKVKFTNAWVFSQIKPAGMFDNVMMTGLKKVSETSRKTGKPTKKKIQIERVHVVTYTVITFQSFSDQR